MEEPSNILHFFLVRKWFVSGFRITALMKNKLKSKDPVYSSSNVGKKPLKDPA